MTRKLNFNAGPATLPTDVLREAAEAVIGYKDTGMSILELPHRGEAFIAIVEESKALVKELCGLGDDHEVLWLQGGGRLQFCMIPMNFASEFHPAGYIDSGHWAEEASEYAAYYGDSEVLASSKSVNYNRLPEWPVAIPSNLAYLHITTNNTIYGTQWHDVPPASVPLVGDMSSDIFCMRRDYTRYALFYAAVQKNLGTAGTALAVVRKDMLNKLARPVAPMLNYKEQARKNSILNTANVFGVYTSLLMLRWTKARGIAAIELENRKKAAMLYDALDNSSIFTPHVAVKEHRSLMNVCFTARDKELETAFINACAANDITGVKGHRSVGGFRVSLYNAIPAEDVATLVEVMKQFEAKA